MRSIETTPLEEWIRLRIGKEGGQLARSEIEAWQLGALKETLAFVKERSPFYKEHLSGMEPEDFDCLSDVGRIPFMKASDIVEQGNRLICVSQNEIRRIVTLDTSGTTGNPKRIHYTDGDQELTIDFFHHGMATFTEAGDRVLVLLPGRMPGSIGDLLRTGLGRKGVEAIVYGIVDDCEAVMDIILERNITGIVGIPQQLAALAQSERSSLVKDIGKLRSVLLSTDYVSPAISERIGRAWGCSVYEHYGMTEMGLGGGVFCKAFTGYHLREADMLFEIIDPLTGSNVPDGTFGEVVFTTLTRTAMPLIRYRTGDWSRFLSKACSCGTILKTMERVRHRITAAVVLEDGLVLTMPMLEDILFTIDEITDFDANIDKAAGQLDILVNTAGEPEWLKPVILSKLENSILKDTISAGSLKINIGRQGCKAPDIKAIRKRNLMEINRRTDNDNIVQII